MQLPSSWKVIAFTVNLLIGLALSQILGAYLDHHYFHYYAEVVAFLTMWCLSFIMCNVGYEFTLDKNDLMTYFWDYMIAMTAAGFPWLFVAIWFMLTLAPIPVDEAFLVARFAAPTSAGILFSMLEAAGLRETWVFQKARVLAIFDDLDTILLMIPLKIMMIGFKWELTIVVGIMAILLAISWVWLHRVKLPYSWPWTILYGLITAAFCKGIHLLTHDVLHMAVPVHIEVLLPAFVIGCIIDTPVAREELEHQRQNTMMKKMATKNLGAVANSAAASSAPAATSMPRSPSPMTVDSTTSTTAPHDATATMPPITAAIMASQTTSAGEKIRRPSKMSTASKNSGGSKESRLSRHGHKKHEIEEHEEDEFDHKVQTAISMVFMVLVGLSMPPMFGENADAGEELDPGFVIGHLVMVSFLMIIGKMFPAFCYRDEAPLLERLALCIGMCPRGEVGASIVVISLDLGVSGPAIIISMCALVINLVMSGGFIALVKLLIRRTAEQSLSKVSPELDASEWAAAKVAAAPGDAVQPMNKGKSASGELTVDEL